MSRISIDRIISDWKNEQKYTPINIEAIENGLIKASADISEEDGETCVGVPIMRVDDTIECEIDEKTQLIDKEITKQLRNNSQWTTKDLHPFPLLGIPGWHPENEQEIFYKNKAYFRDKKTK